MILSVHSFSCTANLPSWGSDIPPESKKQRQSHTSARLLALASFTLMIASQATQAKEAKATELFGEKPLSLEAVVVEERQVNQDNQQIDSQSLRLHKIVDLAEILSDELVEASMIRKSGYGNEVNLRGFGQANLPIMINGGFLEGACGGRKDPALSHINLLTVEKLIVREGPYDVTHPGALGGSIDVITKQPAPGNSGELLTRIGSFGFQSAGATSNAGTEKIQMRVGYNFSKSGQFEDGDGRKLWTLREGRAASFNSAGKGADSFEKQDVWASLRLTPNQTHSIQFDYAFGEAHDILNPRGDFDTARESTKLARLLWNIKEMGAFSEKLSISAYYNAVGHYPTQKLRSLAVPKSIQAKSEIAGASIRNEQKVGETHWSYGADTYSRQWKGDVYNANTGALLNAFMMPDARTLNIGAYLRGERAIGAWHLSSGLRFDHFRTEAKEKLPFSQQTTLGNQQRDALPSGYASVQYKLSKTSKLFAALGRSYRVPTGSERYLQSSSSFFGNPELKPAANTEIDLGWKHSTQATRLEIKAFQSFLKDYIYQVKTLTGQQTYANIDARIVGADAKGSYTIGSGVSLSGGIALQSGRKHTLPYNNTNRNLGQMSPFKARLAMEFERELSALRPQSAVFASLEGVHGSRSKNVDTSAGEIALPSWEVANLRIGLRLAAWSITAGIDNLLDKSYAVANSYEWDVMSGEASNPIVVNEPGRFAYLSASYQW